MVAWYPLDETSGTTVTDIWGGLNGTAQPGPIGSIGPPSNGPAPGTLAPITQAAMVGGSLYFYPQGANRHVQVPNISSLNFGAGSFTIDAWVYHQPPGSPISVVQPILDKVELASNPVGGIGYRLFILNNQLSFVLLDGGTAVSTQAPITPGQWHHVAAVRKGGTPNTVEVYIDGQLASSSTPSVGSISNTANLLIGSVVAGASGLPNPFSYGEIALDELEIFSVALSASDIQSIYNAGSAGKCKGMPVPTGPTPIVGGGAACFPLQQPLSSIVVSPNPFVARPLGEAISGGTYYLLLEFGAFAGPVDIYIAAQLPPPATGPLFMLTSPNVLAPYPPPVPFAGLAPTLGPVALNTTMNNLLSVTPMSSIPPGTYTGHVVVVPTGTNPTLFPAIPYYHWCFFRTFP